jgi:hypothetical protein
LIAKFFKKVPSERITIQEIFQHPWVTNIESVTAGKVSSAHSEPMLSNSTAELSLAAKLESAGFNVPVILNSVYSNACDQSSALWHLLLAKQSDDSIAPGKIEIATSGVGHYFEDAQKTPVSANPLLHIVSHTSFSDELQHSDPVLSPSRMTTKKTRKEVQRPATAGVPKITTFKKSGCFDDSDSSPCSSEAFTVTFKQRPQSAGSSRPPSVRKKTHHDIEVEEMLPIEEPTVQDNSRPLGGLLRVSEHLKSKGIQEEEEPYSPS